MAQWPTAKIHGQESLLLSSATVELAITKLGGMLAPVTFYPGSLAPISPYHVAPWAEECVPVDTPPMLRALRGDWFCSAFGENKDHLPPHGETANGSWEFIDGSATEAGSWLRLGLDLPRQGGRCESTTALLKDHAIVYQRHDLTNLSGPINPGHHATLQFPNMEGAGRLSFSRPVYASTYFHAIDGPPSQHYSRLQPGCELSDLRAVRCSDGTITDLTRFPARRGFDDIVILCADPTLKVAWVAVTFPEQGYVWFALRNSMQLASTLLWFSNGGRPFPPWSGRHINVLGIEDITAFFHIGAHESCRPNDLTARGIRTWLNPDAQGHLSIPYIQGVARIPTRFDRLASVEPHPSIGTLTLTSDSGVVVETSCDIEFLGTDKLQRLDI